MLEMMKTMLSTALKDNPSLHFAVITGCLKIAKESIFTGTNNFVSDTITSTRLSEYFGFTQTEVDRILDDARMRDKAEQVKAWYDGYSFLKEKSVYNPKAVVEAMLSGVFDSYWTKTETYEALRTYIELNFGGLKDMVTEMLAGAHQHINTGRFSNDMTTFEDADDVLLSLIHI